MINTQYGNQSDNEYTYGTQNQSKYGPTSDNKKKDKAKRCVVTSISCIMQEMRAHCQRTELGRP